MPYSMPLSHRQFGVWLFYCILGYLYFKELLMTKEVCKFRGGAYCLNHDNKDTYCEFVKQEDRCHYSEKEEQE